MFVTKKVPRQLLASEQGAIAIGIRAARRVRFAEHEEQEEECIYKFGEFSSFTGISAYPRGTQGLLTHVLVENGSGPAPELHFRRPTNPAREMLPPWGRWSP
mmetsp:Transcript_59889/g.126775  ORF Transcript_59889/g.126775 Transcript_59889/m.126775 type:complete len:102 (-) Transcript_59889:1145-1450(-)